MSSFPFSPTEPLTTAIGSLPHHNIDSALEYAFRWKIPFLPQIPVRHPNEYMIHQALEGLPGLIPGEKGEISLNRATWMKENAKLADKLEETFRSTSPTAFRDFEPSADSYSCWQPFLWELGERKLKMAKIQIAGPMTSQWALRLDDGSPADKLVEVGTQIFRLVLAKSMAMIRRLKEVGVTPLLYVDEPGFYCFSRRMPRHLLGLQELKLFLQTLKKEGALLGLHCCSNTDWDSVLDLEIDLLSIDTTLSLNSLLDSSAGLKQFLQKGGALSLGVVPTAKGHDDLSQFIAGHSFESMLGAFNKAGFSPVEIKDIFRRAVYTPACGLALHKVEDTETVLEFVEAVANLAFNGK